MMGLVNEMRVPVTRIRTTTAGRDPLGNQIRHRSEEQVMVFAIWVPSSDEAVAAGHPRTVTDAKMIAAPGDFQSDDEVHADSFGSFLVDGNPHDYDHNPWFTPEAVVVNLRRTDG